VRSATPKQGSANCHCVYARAAGVRRDHDHDHNFRPSRENKQTFSPMYENLERKIPPKWLTVPSH
jgi:hypothetical protein